MFKKLFGGAKDSPAAPVQAPSAASANRTINTIQSLNDNEEQLEKRKALLEKRIAAELEKAREYSKQQKKPQALQCLKKKKLLENELGNLDNMIMRVIEQRTMLEGQRTTVEVMSAMHGAAMTAKENMKAMKIENVDKVLDEINETTDQMRQINEAFSAPTGLAADLDEDELLNELEEMEATQLDAELLEPAAVPQTRPQQALPTVPTGHKVKPTPAKTQEELELEALQAEMAM